MLRYVAISFLMPFSLMAQNEWVLQSWTLVKGVAESVELGRHVSRLPQGPSFPYRAAVSQVERTSLFSLNSSSDTTALASFLGENILHGDLNNDGYEDLIATQTVEYWDTVFVYWGTVLGIDWDAPLKIPGENIYEGFHAETVGDVNNDGFQDLVCTSASYPELYSRGKIYLFLGPNITAHPQDTLVGDMVQATLGVRCVLADLDADGLNDFIVRGWHRPIGDTKYDYVNIYYGKSQWLVSKTPDIEIHGYDLYSKGLAAFDINGDGIDDLLWTNRDLVDSTDWIYVHYGGSALRPMPSIRLRDPGVATFGSMLKNAGDMNGDGCEDLVVGCPAATFTTGLVLVYSGGPLLDADFDAAVGESSDSDFGRAVAGIGDINNDGLSDIIVGAPAYSFDSGKGLWGIFLGSRNIPITSIHGAPNPAIPNNIFLSNYPNPFNSTTTITYELPEPGSVSIRVYDTIGRIVASVAPDIQQTAGEHSLPFDAYGMTSGAYRYELIFTNQDGFTISRVGSMIVIK